VLLGRDRMSRFPFFTASIVLVALRLLSSRLLFGKLPQVTMSAVFIVMADLGAILGILVLVELGRRAFGGKVKRHTWVLSSLTLFALGAIVLRFWGPWPAWKTLVASSQTSVLQLLQLLAQKGNLLLDVLTICLGVLIVLCGRHYGAGWRSHTQQIMIGLSTASISQLAFQIVWEVVARHTTAHTMDEYNHILDLRGRLLNANSAVFLVVMIWWIVCLWIDEPGTAKADAAPKAEYLGPDGTAESAGE
jgi:hypothetical protein